MSLKSETATEITSKQVEPPPESFSSIWTRRWIIVAFWIVALCLGLPHWTWTTSIHRSELPLESMREWVEGRACALSYPLHISLRAAHLGIDQRKSLASNVEMMLNGRQEIPFFTFHVTTDGSHMGINDTMETVLTINLETSPDAGAPKATLSSWTPTLNVQHNSQSPDPVSDLIGYLADEISVLFRDEGAALSHLLRSSPYVERVRLQAVSDEKRSQLDARTTRAFKYASTYHLTFSLFTPTASPSAWEINEAVEQYIAPLLAPLSTISKFTIDTQVQLYASFSLSIAGPFFNPDDDTWRLQYGDLTGFINAAEWPLNPSIGSGPTINFVLYVPSPDKSPLLIQDGGGTNWLIPQWGGVQIHNPTSNQSSSLKIDDLRQDMLIFADQLASLLGLPASPPSLAFRISSLTRERATSVILSASSTLGALARLTFKLTSIAIPDSVAQSVHETVNRLDNACADLKAGRYQSALENARIAEEEVEKAFFEPSMVGQVYFPEEHKVAVYVPLLGPMAVPLIMAGVKELKALLRKNKAKGA